MQGCMRAWAAPGLRASHSGSPAELDLTMHPVTRLTRTSAWVPGCRQGFRTSHSAARAELAPTMHPVTKLARTSAWVPGLRQGFRTSHSAARAELAPCYGCAQRVCPSPFRVLRAASCALRTPRVMLISARAPMCSCSCSAGVACHQIACHVCPCVSDPAHPKCTSMPS